MNITDNSQVQQPHLLLDRNITTSSKGGVRPYGFPIGVSLNHVAAHDSPNPKGKLKILRYSDVLKVDFGPQVRGWIIDAAFTVAFDPRHDELLRAVRDATEAGIRTAGVGVTLGEVGAAVQRVMESRYTNITSRTASGSPIPTRHGVRVRVIRNLCGHNMEQWKIHAGKTVHAVACSDDTVMEEGEVYAIETFGSTGNGFVVEGSDCSHYMWNYDEEAPDPNVIKHHLRMQNKTSAIQLMNHIMRRHKTLAFCRRWLDQEGFKNHKSALERLVRLGVVMEYPPLEDRAGCYTAQFEHTIYLGPDGKEVLTRGEDY